MDVTHATDCPTIDKKTEGDISLGKGPVVYRGPNMHPQVVERLLQAGENGDIPIQLSAFGRATPTDANALQVTRDGVATGLVSVPNRYMHSAVETVSLDDADKTADLLAAFCRGLVGDIDWSPKVGTQPMRARAIRLETTPAKKAHLTPIATNLTWISFTTICQKSVELRVF